jgi:hypothetical protein
MRLYGTIEKVEVQSDGTVRVSGIATSEAVDEQGEIVRAAAMRAAMPDYMRFPALREMHQLSAAGTTLEAEVSEDGTTRIVAHVVDPVAVAKVKNQVYRGFSIGGRVTQRDAANPKVITGLVLNEISLVDRPANPEAIFDCWKAADDAKPLGKMPGLSISKQTATAQGPFNSPIQVWACGVSDHRHLTKAEAVKCLEQRETGTADLQTEIIGAKAAVSGDQDTAWPASSCKNSVEQEDRNVEYADPGCQPDSKSAIRSTPIVTYVLLGIISTNPGMRASTPVISSNTSELPSSRHGKQGSIRTVRLLPRTVTRRRARYSQRRFGTSVVSPE